MLWESENRAEQCRILQIGTVDAGNGTLFGTRNKRAIQRDHLTLVIGICSGVAFISSSACFTVILFNAPFIAEDISQQLTRLLQS